MPDSPNRPSLALVKTGPPPPLPVAHPARVVLHGDRDSEGRGSGPEDLVGSWAAELMATLDEEVPDRRLSPEGLAWKRARCAR